MARRRIYRVRSWAKLVRGVVLLALVVALPFGVYFAARALFSGRTPTPTAPAVTLTVPPSPTPADAPTPTPTPMQVIRIKLESGSGTLRVRSQPSTSGDVLGEVSHDATLPYSGESGGWWVVNYNGQTGYILGTFGVLETITPSPTP